MKKIIFVATIAILALLFCFNAFAAEVTECTITHSPGTFKVDQYVCYGSSSITVYTAEQAAAAGIPQGFSDTVWAPGAGSGAGRGALLDFSALKIPTDRVKSINFRVYLPKGVSEIRVNDPSPVDNWIYRSAYGNGDDSGKRDEWVDLQMSAATMSSGSFETISVNGYLDKFELTVRYKDDEPSDTKYFYIDSVTITYLPEQYDENVNFTITTANSTDSNLNCYTASGPITRMTYDQAVAEGLPAGFSGNVWKIGPGGGTAVGAMIEFPDRKIKIADITSLTFRIYSAKDTSADFPNIRIANMTGVINGGPAGAWPWLTTNPTGWPGIWHDFVLKNASVIKKLDVNNDGYLDRFNLISRRDSSVPFYIDTIKITTLKTLDPEKLDYTKMPKLDVHDVIDTSSSLYNPPFQAKMTLYDIDGAPADAPAGYSGYLWRFDANGQAGTTAIIDCSAMKIPSSQVTGVKIRMYLGSKATAFRGNPRNLGAGANRMFNTDSTGFYPFTHSYCKIETEKWIEFTVKDEILKDAFKFSTAKHTDENGYFKGIEIAPYHNGGAYHFYIDEVTILTTDMSEFPCDINSTTELYIGNVSTHDSSNMPAQIKDTSYSGTVAKITSTSTSGATTVLDFSKSKIPADKIASISFRVWAPDDKTVGYYPAIRFSMTGGKDTWIADYSAYDLEKLDALSKWTNIELTSEALYSYGKRSFSSFADENGYFKGFNITSRSASNFYFYIDSITVNFVDGYTHVWPKAEEDEDDTPVAPDEPEDDIVSEFTQFDYSVSESGNPFFTYGAGTVEEVSATKAMFLGAPAGATGNVLYVDKGTSGGAGVLIDFAKSEIPTTIIDSITFRVFTEDNEVTANASLPSIYIKKGPLPFRRDVVNQTLSSPSAWKDVTIYADGRGFAGIRNMHALQQKDSVLLGKFELATRYAARARFFIDSITVTTAADDETAPVITYNGENTVYMASGVEPILDVKAYDETEMRAIDVEYIWEDGEVPTESGTYTLTLTACDYYGNTAEKEITVVVGTEDTEKPVIHLNTTEIYAKAGTVSCENVKVTDNYDVASVEYSWSDGAVDAIGRLNAGTHTLTIVATDASGNTSSKTVTVYADGEGDSEDNIVDEEQLKDAIMGEMMGAQIRTEGKYGLRFGTKIVFTDDIALDDVKFTTEGEQIDGFYAGTLVVPQYKLPAGVTADTLTHANMPQDTADVEAENIFDEAAEDGTAAIYTAVVTDIPENGGADVVFVARAYVKFNGEYYYFTPVVRSVNQVIGEIGNDNGQWNS